MSRPIAAVCALVLAAPVLLLPVPSGAVDRTLPMHFKLQKEGPATLCRDKCRVFISASGAITADTPRDFQNFAKGRDLTGALVVLDSDGGSVHGAIAVGREIRRLGLDTTVGHVVDVSDDGQGAPRAKLTARADCESMCAFVLLAGVHRSVPDGARVMVHQIWLGDRRDDPTAANYSAEDLVLVQRDIGKLAQYTIEMGASIEVLDLALRIPPWEPMHTLTVDEIRRAHVATADQPANPAAATVASTPPAQAKPMAPATSGLRPTAISERYWSVVDHAGTAVLARRHPLTVEGEEIGSFDLILACGQDGDSYDVSYIERRHGGEGDISPDPLRTVTLNVGYGKAVLKIVSSEHRDDPGELVSYATGTVPASLIGAFGALGQHSMTIKTRNGRFSTGIRLGNTGVEKNLPQLAAGCGKALGHRADLALHQTGGAAAK